MELVVILIIDVVSLIASAVGEFAANRHGGQNALWGLVIALFEILEARLVDDFCSQNLGVGNLQGLFGLVHVVAL